MKKRTIAPFICLGLIIAFLVFLWHLHLSGSTPSELAAAAQAQKEQSQEQKSPAESSDYADYHKKGYTIEHITPQIVLILSFRTGRSGEAFSAALKEISEKYIIKNIVPLTSTEYNCTGTTELILIVEPKK